MLPAIVASGLMAFLAVARPLGPRAFDDLTMLPTYPIATMDFVVANDLMGNAFTLYNWGGYVQLRTGGRLKVYIDGRADTVYSDRVYTDYGNVAARAPGWEAIIERSGADYVLWPRAAPRHWQTLLDSGTWRMLQTDLVSVLLVRADREGPPRPIVTDSAYRRLADGWDAFVAGDRDRAEDEFRHAQQMDPDASQICHLRLLAATAGKAGAGPRALGAGCGARFPYRDYLTGRLGFVPVPRAPSS